MICSARSTELLAIAGLLWNKFFASGEGTTLLLCEGALLISFVRYSSLFMEVIEWNDFCS